MARLTAILVLFGLLITPTAVLVAQSPSESIVLAPGTSYHITCETRFVETFYQVAPGIWNVECQALPPTSTPAPAPTDTPVPTATEVPPTATATAVPTSTSTPPPPPTSTSVPAHDAMHWHPPGFGHEHGDAPPAWLTSAGYMPMFNHPANTPTEAELKHTSFKGFILNDDGVQTYFIMHLDTNPNGHTSRFHSYQAWARDPSGNISYWDLWADFGTGTGPGGMTGPRLQANEECGGGGRPVMFVNYRDGCPLFFESWYSRAGAPGFGWDFGFNVSAQYYCGPQLGQPCTDGSLSNMPNWLPTGDLNRTRRIEAAWYQSTSYPRGEFYTTQWGDVVSGLSDPICGTSRAYGAKSYTVLCLRQYLAPTMSQLSFPGNARQAVYPMGGVTLPN